VHVATVGIGSEPFAHRKIVAGVMDGKPAVIAANRETASVAGDQHVRAQRGRGLDRKRGERGPFLDRRAPGKPRDQGEEGADDEKDRAGDHRHVIAGDEQRPKPTTSFQWRGNQFPPRPG